MKGLLMKDLKLMKHQIKFFITIVAISLFLLMGTSNGSFAIAYLTFVGTMFTLSTISYDELDNGYAFLFCLPISRKTYVLEKYSFGLLTGGVSWLLGVVIGLLISMAKHTLDTEALFFTALAVLPAVLVMLAVMIPIRLKFGSEKGRMVVSGVLGVLAALCFIVAKIASAFHIDLAGSFRSFPVLPVGLVISAAILGLLLLMLLSIRISIAIIRKKEF